MIYSGGPLAAGIPAVDLASVTLARPKEPGGKPALIDGPSGRALSYADLTGDSGAQKIAAWAPRRSPCPPTSATKQR